MLRVSFIKVSSALRSLSVKSLGKQTLDSRKTPEIFLMLRSVPSQARNLGNSNSLGLPLQQQDHTLSSPHP